MTPQEIQNKTFDKRMGGYKPEDVTNYMADIADYIQDLLDEKEELQEKMMVLADKIEEYREDEDSLRAALIGAQKLGDNVIRDAKKKAEMLISEASRKAEDLISDAKSSIDREAIALARMQGQVSDFKEQILALYRQQIEMINGLPEEAALPGDVKKIVDDVIEEASPIQFSSQKRNEEMDIDLEEGSGDEDDFFTETKGVGGQKFKPRGDFGNLRFGEEYNLTRNE